MSSSNGEDTASLFVNIIELVANFYIRVYSLKEIGQVPGPFRPFYEISGFIWLEISQGLGKVDFRKIWLLHL